MKCDDSKWSNSTTLEWCSPVADSPGCEGLGLRGPGTTDRLTDDIVRGGFVLVNLSVAHPVACRIALAMTSPPARWQPPHLYKSGGSVSAPLRGRNDIDRFHEGP